VLRAWGKSYYDSRQEATAIAPAAGGPYFAFLSASGAVPNEHIQTQHRIDAQSVPLLRPACAAKTKINLAR
jgi:hypothetical protein